MTFSPEARFDARMRATARLNAASVLPTEKALSVVESFKGSAMYLVFEEFDEKIVESKAFATFLVN